MGGCVASPGNDIRRTHTEVVRGREGDWPGDERERGHRVRAAENRRPLHRSRRQHLDRLREKALRRRPRRAGILDRALSPDEVARRATGQEVETSGLAGLWHLDEGTGGIVRDASGQGHDGIGVDEPLSWVKGRYGTALRFTGTSHVEIPDSLTLASQQLTVEVWVRAERSPGDDRYILGKG